MNTLRLTLALALVSSVALLGCDPDPTPVDSGMGRDSGTPTDAGPEMDSGMTMTDAGPDSGMMMMGACTPAGGSCDFIDQDCPAGEGCIGRIRDMPSACVSAGVGTDGDACDPMMIGECAAGFDCAPDGACREICCPEAGATACGEIGYICQGFVGGFGYCLPTDDCDLVYDPAAPTCDPGESCLLAGGDGSVRCTPLADMIAVGEPCMFNNSCELGAGCFDFGMGMPRSCYRFCDTATGAQCTGTEMCTPVTSFPDGVGACIPM